jgi:membrane-associated protein
MGPSPNDAGDVLSWLVAALLASAGRHAVAVAVVGAFADGLVGLGVLVPGGAAVILAGFAVQGQGAAGYLQVAAGAWAGQLVATTIDYWLGRLAGRRLIPRRAPWRLAARWRRTLRASRAFLVRWGAWAIVVANLAEPGRSSLAIAAGASRWPFGAFIARQAAVSVVWSAVFCGLGFFAAGGSGGVLALVGGLGLAAAGVLLLAVAGPSLARAAARIAARYGRSRARRSGRDAVASAAAEEAVAGASPRPG